MLQSVDTKCVMIHQHPQPVTRVKVASASSARPPANPLKEDMEERGDRYGGGAMSEGLCVEVTKGRGGQRKQRKCKLYLRDWRRISVLSRRRWAMDDLNM